MKYHVILAAALWSAAPALGQSAPVAPKNKPAAPTPSAIVAAPAPRPVLDFAELPFMESPKLSPDGKKMAARLAVNGVQSLAIISLFTKDPPALIGLGESDLIEWRWVNDGWVVIRVGNEDTSLAEPIYITRVAGVRADGKTITPIAFRKGGQHADILWTANDQSPRILMSMQNSIFMGEDFWPTVSSVDVSTGKIHKVLDGIEGVSSWIPDRDGNVRIGIGVSDEGRKARLLYRPGGTGSFKTVDRANFRLRETLAFPILLPDRMLTFASSEGFNALYDFDIAAMKPGKKIWGAEGYDIDGIVTNAATGMLDGITYTSDRSRIHWISPAMAQTQTLLDKAVGDRTASIVSTTNDSSSMIVHVARADAPGAYYFWNTANGSMNRFAYVNQRIKSDRLSPVSAYRYKAKDGLSIESFLTLPKGREAKALPLILMPHGGPAARDELSYDWWAQFLADRGYAVVQPNYRGSTGYGEKFREAGEGQWGLKMQDDLNDAVDDLVARGIVDPKRVCIVGASYGGYAAMRAAQRDGGRFRCAVSYAGVSDLGGMLRYNSQFLNAEGGKDWIRRQAPDLRSVSPLNFAEQFSTPILIAHGKKDRRVPYWQSSKMISALKGAGKVHEVLTQPEGDHFFSRQEDRRTFLEALEAFLKKHNPA
jgi:dipeptidyl aminopeptidase/acylaminoacyl peptidase